MVSLDTSDTNTLWNTFHQIFLHQTKRLAFALLVALPFDLGTSLHIPIDACALSAWSIHQPRTHLNSSDLTPLPDKLFQPRGFPHRCAPLILLRAVAPPLDRAILKPIPCDNVELFTVIAVTAEFSLGLSIVKLDGCKHGWVFNFPILLGTNNVRGGVVETHYLAAAVVLYPLSNLGGWVTEVPEDEDGACGEGWHDGCIS